MSDRHPLVVKLKSGEYAGKDIMNAWILRAIEGANGVRKENFRRVLPTQWF